MTLAVMLASAGPTVHGQIEPEVSGEKPPVVAEGPLVIVIPPPVPEAVPEPPPVAGEADSVIIVNANPRHIRADPLSGLNATTFEVVEVVDKAVVAPVAGTYEKIVPTPVRNGLRNVLVNLAEPVVFLNYLLQFKPGKALETLGRFGINSTIGVAGLFDMARRKPFNLPYRQNGFANTMAYHGLGSGPYFYLPLLGPTTARDLAGRLLDLSVLPTAFGSPFTKPAYSLSTGALKAMNDRIAFDERIKATRSEADPYVASRDFYLQRRKAEIDALHSAEYRARKGIADPVLPAIPAHVNEHARPGSEAARPTTYIPSSMGGAPAVPAPEEPVSGTPALPPVQPAPDPKP